MQNPVRWAGMLLISGILLLVGCRVKQSNDAKDVDVDTPLGKISVKNSGKDAKDKSVDITTPFGGLQVRTDDVQAKDLGLSVYPNARLAPRSGHDDSQANVNIATAWFGVKVVALKYESDDAPDKLLDFYKKEMSKYGKVLQCQNGREIGGTSPRSGDSHELTCDDHDSKSKGPHLDLGEHDDTIELKVGSKERQRIVAVKPRGSGSGFELVYVQTRETRETM